MNKETIDCVLVIVQIATLIALIVYVWKTWQMASATRKASEAAQNTVNEMKTSREAEYRPYVVAYFELVRHNIILFTVKNNGHSQAREISVIFEPEIKATNGDKIRRILSSSFGDFSLQPQQLLQTYVDQISRYLNNDQFPSSYKIIVQYKSGDSSQRYEDVYYLDLGVYKGLLVLDDKDIPALVDELRHIKEKTNLVAASLKRLADTVGSKVDNEESTNS